jgi:predicted transcriptional regulator of viral defense system
MRAELPSRRAQALAELATRQHGVVSRRQLEEAGWGRSAIGRLVEKGHLHRLHRGVFAVGHRVLTPRGRWLAAVLAAGDGGVLFRRSAAARWGLGPDPLTAEIAVPRRLRGQPRLRFLHRFLAADETTIRDGIPVTTVARTLLDLAAVLPRDRLERALNEAEYRRYADAPSLSELLERHRGARGTASLRAILGRRQLGESITRSELEDRFLSLIDRAHLPPPQVNAPLRVADRWIEADCAWPGKRLVVELDGRAAHSTTGAFERDRARDRQLQAAGWRVIRITWRQLHDDPEAVIADLRCLAA